jgi:hypothetical protein
VAWNVLNYYALDAQTIQKIKLNSGKEPWASYRSAHDRVIRPNYNDRANYRNNHAVEIKTRKAS